MRAARAGGPASSAPRRGAPTCPPTCRSTTNPARRRVPAHPAASVGSAASASTTSPWNHAISCSDSPSRCSSPLRRDPALDSLHERLVLRADLLVEREVTGEPFLVDAGADEVVEEPVGPVRAAGHDGPIERLGRPGMTFTTVAGEEEVELARATSPRASYTSPPGAAARHPRRRADLRREPAARIEPVRVGRDVERLREGRVRDRAVVALEEVLDADLPVARVLVGLRARVEAQRVDVDPAVGEKSGQLAERVGQRLRLAVRVDEDERPPRLHRRPRTSPSAPVSKTGSRSARGAPQSAVEAVRPGVVRALDRLAPRVALAEQVPAVAADVHEAAELAVARAASTTGSDPPRRSSAGRARRPGRPARVLPRAREDPLLLEARHGRVGVPVVRQGARPAIVATGSI